MKSKIVNRKNDPSMPARHVIIASEGLSMLDWAPSRKMNGNKKYAIIVKAIEEGIEKSVLQPGMRLPPQREIAEYFGVTIATVTKAINIASQKNLVSARAGSGTYIRPSSNPAAESQQEAPSPIVDLSLNVPPVSITSGLLQENLQEMATAGASIFSYEAIPGSPAHRKAGSLWFALRDFRTSPEQVMVTQGAHEGLTVSLLALTRPGDIVLCEQLNYTGLRRIGHLLGLRLVGIELDGEGLDADAVGALIAEHAPKAIVCTPITHNPTTATLSQQRRQTLVDAARSAGVPIIEDDIYGLFSGQEIPPLATLWPEGVIVVTSLSKTVAPGLRIGYVAAPASLMPRIRDAMFMLAWTEPSLQAAIASHLIVSGRAERCLKLHQTEAHERLGIARRILGSLMLISHQVPSYHIWVSTDVCRPDDIAAELARRGIQLSPASHFAINAQLNVAALRISLGNVSYANELEQPLQMLADRLVYRHSAALGSIV